MYTLENENDSKEFLEASVIINSLELDEKDLVIEPVEFEGKPIVLFRFIKN